MMKAIRIHSYGGPEVMRLEELPLPVPGAAQALVRVCAASVNFLDVQKRRGELVGQAFYQRAGGGEPEFPAILGSQGVGVVEAIGSEVRMSASGTASLSGALPTPRIPCCRRRGSFPYLTVLVSNRLRGA